MSIQGIHSSYPHAAVSLRPRGADAVVAGRIEPASRAVDTAPRVGRTLPTAAPDRTDSSLWGVLTSDERAFFARATSAAPLTYGTSGQAAPAVSLGGRIDVKV